MSVAKPVPKLSRLENLYDELLSQHPDHWYAVLDEELIHSADRADVADELRRRGLARGEVLIAHLPGTPPYLIL